ncbi:tRNA dihydrouridine synthase DusB [Candidatus Woesearchaeota archaeon]|nr:tRNA dihydrouridine synthase DusB [Candidatus Woesearchaeota archaeon]
MKNTQKIGNVKLKGRIFLSPMAGYTDVAFRTLCKRYGAALVVTELISSNTLVNADLSTIQQLKTSEEEKPLAFQLFGSDINLILKASKIIENRCEILNINMGCPAAAIVQQGSGSALLEKPEHIGKIIKKLSTNLSIPITIKIRAGISKENINAVEIAKIAEKNGCSAICIHPRTQKQGYKGDADWNIIKHIKESVSIPIIGNGGIVDEISAKKMFNQTNCDFIMIGRAAIGNPMIFQRINNYLKKGIIDEKFQESIFVEKIRLFKEYHKLWQKHELSFVSLKDHAVSFFSGFPNASTHRGSINKIKDESELMDYVGSLNQTDRNLHKYFINQI